MALCLVTGGAGFIGSHLVERLLSAGHAVRVLDDGSTGNKKNIACLMSEIQFTKGSILDPSLLNTLMKDVEYVFHLAAIPSVQRSIDDPVTTSQTNVMGTVSVLQAARNCGVTRVIYASSSSVYGDTETLPKVEAMPPNPLSPYALQKMTSEGYVQLFHRIYGLETLSLRYFNVFGPRQNPNSPYSAVIPKFITSHLRSEPVVIRGDGEQSRDFTYVSNVTWANLLAMRAPSASAKGQVYNVGCGQRFTLKELISALSEIAHEPFQVEFESSRVGDVRHSLASIDRIEKDLGYQPEIDFHEGLKRTLEWYRAKQTEGAGEA